LDQTRQHCTITAASVTMYEYGSWFTLLRCSVDELVSHQSGKLTPNDSQNGNKIWGCEVSQMVAQVSAGYRNRYGCPSRSDRRGPRSAKAACRCDGIGEGYTEPEESLSLWVAHACADLATSQLWSHWTIEQGSELAKAADMCGTLRNTKGELH
jgi:hypothetical protein